MKRLFKNADAKVGITSDLEKELQVFLADLFVEHISYKHRHWNVKGLTFKDIHEMFDDATAEMLDFIDTIGEYIVSFKKDTEADVVRISQRSVIEPQATSKTDPRGLLNGALSNAIYLKDKLSGLNELANEEKQFGLCNAVEDMITRVDKLIYKYQQYLA